MLKKATEQRYKAIRALGNLEDSIRAQRTKTAEATSVGADTEPRGTESWEYVQSFQEGNGDGDLPKWGSEDWGMPGEAWKSVHREYMGGPHTDATHLQCSTMALIASAFLH